MVDEHITDFGLLRAMKDEDYNFVLSSWAKSFKGSPWAGLVPNNLWHSTMKEALDQLLERGAKVRMLVDRLSPDFIIGWTCFEESECGVNVIHYVFVKDAFREKFGSGGLLRDLACGRGSYGFRYTCRTHDGQRLVGKKDVYSPAIARRKNLEPVKRIDK